MCSEKYPGYLFEKITSIGVYMNNFEHVPLKKVLTILTPLFVFLLFFIGYALKEKTYLSLGYIIIILLAFIMTSFLLISFFYKKSLSKPIGVIKTDNDIMDDYINIRQGQFGNQKTILGKWYGAVIIIAIIFPFFAKIIINYTNFSRPDYVILISGYVIIFTFVIGIIITNRKK